MFKKLISCPFHNYFDHANCYHIFCLQLRYLDSEQDDSDVVNIETKQTKQKARFTKRDDPYKVYEQLHLSLEEVCTIMYIRQFSFTVFEIK